MSIHLYVGVTVVRVNEGVSDSTWRSHLGWSGTLRRLEVAARRAERAQQRKHSELVKRQEQAAKLGRAQQAELEVARYENYLELITSIHCDCGESWDWISLKDTPAPKRPEYSNELEAAEREKRLRPVGLMDRVLGRGDSMRRASQDAIEAARAADQARYDRLLEGYEASLSEWETLHRIASGVVAAEVSSFKEALAELKPFSQIKELGRGVKLHFTSTSAEATISVYGGDHIPREIKVLLKNGEVSKRAASDSSIHQIYQTHICSCVLRAGRELFAVLPFKRVFIHAIADLLNSQTGNREPQVIVSILIPGEGLAGLKFEHLDPVATVQSFVHQMSFSKLRGFSPVCSLRAEDYPMV